MLWYDKPAAQWTDALPVGCGRMGAMVFGGVQHERLQLNEDSIYTGGYRDRHNPSAPAAMPRIRQLLRDGRVQEAETLARRALTATPEFMRGYQTLGEALFTFDGMPAGIQGYKRRLCLETATASVEFSAGGHNYKREVIASHPADAIAVHFTTDNPQGMSFDMRLLRWRFCENSGASGDGIIYVSGANGGGDGVKFHFCAAGAQEGGEMESIGEYLVFRGVRKAAIYITAATSFRHDDTALACHEILKPLRKQTFEELRAAHIADYQSLQGRVKLQLPTTPQLESLPTDARLARLREGCQDPGLDAIYFHYGRYLLIACSREGDAKSLPANLQGIWCDDFLAPWDGRYTININLQMNYWHAEATNLAECHKPLFALMRRMHPRGAHTAHSMYGARGWVAHHNTDLWADTAPQDTWPSATYWTQSAAWLCLHIWQHYEYSQDIAFLREHYEILHDAGLFFADFLVENRQGHLVVSPTVSPENTYITDDGYTATFAEGCTMDSQILWELFTACHEAAQILGEIPLFNPLALREQLPPTRTSADGTIMEWPDELKEAEPGHRHISHLFGLYPGSTISPANMPALAAAAAATLAKRLKNGGGHTGWSRAWIICFYAALHDGNAAHMHLQELLRHASLPNLWSNHPPFQIDGNFGATAAISHMLLQSTADTIRLLPALPEQWHTGEICGLRAKGGLTITMKWANNKLTRTKITATHAYTGTAVYGDESYAVNLPAGGEMEVADL